MSATPQPPADLALTGGRIATMDAARSWASGPGRPGRQDRGGGHGSRDRVVRRRVDARHRAPRPHGDPGVPGCPRPSGPRRSGPAPMQPPRLPRGRGLPRGHRLVRAIASGRGLDPRERLVHGRVRRRDPDARGSRPHPARSSGVPDESRRPQRVGQLARLRARRGDRRDRRSERRPDRTRRPTDRRAARSRKARWISSNGTFRTTRRPTSRKALRLGQALSALAGDHGLAGRDHPSGVGGARLRRPRIARRAHGPRRGGDVVGAPPRRRADRGVRRTSPQRPRSGDTRRPA